MLLNDKLFYMLFFSIVSLPALFIIIKRDIKYKHISVFFLGILISSLLSLASWALSTFFQPDGMSFVNNAIKLFFNSVFPLFVFNLIYLIHYIFKWKVKLPSDSFKCGFLYWNMLFSIIQNSHDVKSLVLPVFYMMVLFSLVKIEKVQFKASDSLIKGIYYILLPFYILLSLLLIYYSYAGVVILGLVSISALLVFKFNIKNIRKEIVLS